MPKSGKTYAKRYFNDMVKEETQEYSKTNYSSAIKKKNLMFQYLKNYSQKNIRTYANQAPYDSNKNLNNKNNTNSNNRYTNPYKIYKSVSKRNKNKQTKQLYQKQRYEKQRYYKKKKKNRPIKRIESELNEIIRKNDPTMFEIFKNTIKNRKYYKKKFKPTINEKGCADKTALHEMIRNTNCRFQAFNGLLQWGSEVDAKDSKGNTPLHYAASIGNTQKAYWLMKYNADVDAQNKDGYTPLHLACKNGHTKLAEMLLDNGAFVNMKNNFRYTPLHFAAESSTPNLVYILLRYGAYCHVKTQFGRTPLMRSIQFGNKDDIALLLCESSYNFNDKRIVKVCPNDNIKKFLLNQLRIFIARRCRNILRNEFRMITGDKRSFISIGVKHRKPAKKQNYYDTPKRFQRVFSTNRVSKYYSGSKKYRELFF
jgi:ankyrin repeat protein